MDYLLTKPTTN